MQPKTDVKFDEAHFNRIKRTIRNMATGKRESVKNNLNIYNVPDEVGIQLTNKCNLRCKTCFQWNDEGVFNAYSKEDKDQEIPIALVEQILNATASQKSNLYLWGGEPLSYGSWEDLTLLLEKDPRWTVLCTNGVNIPKKIDSINRISKTLALLISLDGFEKENDAIRGNGVYKKVVNSIDQLLLLQKSGTYKGEISVNCVISEAMIGKLYDFATMFEEKGINTLYLCFPWYLPEQTSSNMDRFFAENFSWLSTVNENSSPSWHAYKYQLDSRMHSELINDLERINKRTWNIRVRYQPALEAHEIAGFLMGEERPAQNKKQCIGLFNRMNVLPNGKVTVCKMYPEFEVGDLSNETLEAVWNGEKVNKVRSILKHQLMPVCSKCILLYLHGV